MQSMGQEAYEARRHAWLALAEDLMTTLEQAISDCRVVLVGRAAEGHFDADPSIHIRVWTREDVGEMSRLLAEYGYDEADQTFPIVNSRHGRLSQWQWVDPSGVRVILTRCPDSRVFDDPNDLVTGKRVARMSVEALRGMIDSRA